MPSLLSCLLAKGSRLPVSRRAAWAMAPALVGALALVAGVGPGRAQEPARPATTWTDPPPRSAGPDASVGSEPAAPARQSAADDLRTVERTDQSGPKPARRAEPAARTAPGRQAERRSAQARRVVTRARTEPRTAARPAIQRTAGSIRVPMAVALPAYADACLEEDPRLERLYDAQAAGYMTLGRRTVRFPDGRSLKVYRPAEDMEED